MFIARVLSPHGCIKHWQWNKDKADNFGDKALTFFNSSPPSLLSRSLVHGKWAGQTTAHEKLSKGLIAKSGTKIFPDVPALLLPPPGSYCQVVHLLSASKLACWMANKWNIQQKQKREGFLGRSSFILRATGPGTLHLARHFPFPLWHLQPSFNIGAK